MSPPNDSVSAMEFSPATSQKTFLIAGSWDSTVRCWEVKENCQAEPKYMYSMNMPVFDVCWNGDGTKVFMASCNNHVECWDLEGNQTMHVATHDAPVKTCHWVQTPPYNCIMTSSWDKTLKVNDQTGNDLLYDFLVTE
ncbi:PREDICTED: mRNA export factor-like [Diuraphis noxia]|uniref:mRNA export factor-like n=1 Tax=Diuraphis noxia TaxID=143948 RepID=UPI0007638650|nr:PREDICTED: mRNA export factor-like [Diuraphis noxia]